jgi:hypothetical protein
MTVVVSLRAWQEREVPLAGSAAVGAAAAWWVVIVVIALVVHTRTLLAPFLAIHADLPATLAALEAWRLSRNAFGACLSTLVVGSLPVALPLGIAFVCVMAVLPQPAREALEPALPDLGYAAIQLIRPILIPATFLLFQDLWRLEHARRVQFGQPPTPVVARLLLALTRPLPRLAPRAR